MDFDAIVIGGGHNGLIAAATLARRGHRLVVLERRDHAGGVAASHEFYPGYHTAGLLHDTSHLQATVVESLGLSEHGLRWRAPADVLLPEPAGRGVLISADDRTTVAEISTHSAVDAEGYRTLCATVDRLRDFVTSLLREPPPRIDGHGLRGALPLLRSGWALRRLGRDALLDCLRLSPMSARDILGEHLRHPLLSAGLAAPALVASWLGPHSAGSGALLLIDRCTAGREVAGGGPALIRALLAHCSSAGVAVHTGARVRQITTHDGAVTGVALDDGSRLRAPLIVSSVDPQQTCFSLLAPTELPLQAAGELASWRCRGTTAALYLALDGPLEFAGRAGPSVEAARIATSLDDLERAFDAVKYREMSERPWLDVRVPTIAEPSLAPPGHHVVSILAHYAPFDLAGGWSERARATLEQRILDRLAEVAPGVRDRIVGHQLLTPADLAHRYALSGGHPYHGEPALDQMICLRPAAGAARYKTAIRGLYLGGSGSHPGGGITGGPGALAAAAVE